MSESWILLFLSFLACMVKSTGFTAKLCAYFTVLNVGVFNPPGIFGFLLLMLLQVYFTHLHCLSLFPEILCVRY